MVVKCVWLPAELAHRDQLPRSFRKDVILSKGHAGRRPFYGCINRSIDLVGSQRESPLPLITR